MKTVRKIMMFLVCALGLTTSSAQMLEIAIYKEVGAVSDLFNGLGEMMGKTSVTPSWGLNTWQNRYFGKYSNKYFSITSTVTRKPIIAGFEYRVVSYREGESTFVTTTPFPVTVARIGVTSCAPSPGFVFITVWRFDMVAQVEHVSWSGRYPPGPPYHGHMATLAHKFTTDCMTLTPTPTPVVKYAPFDLPEYGAIIVSFKDSPYEYHWRPRIACF